MTDLIQRLRDEADLCRAETADDIARLLDEAADALQAPAPAPAPANEVIETGWSVYKLAQGTPGGRAFFRGWRMAEHRHGLDGLGVPEADQAPAVTPTKTLADQVRAEELADIRAMRERREASHPPVQSQGGANG